ncbi:MAG: hypothetical protein QOE96_1096 [Blastocatellia bacterium]|jgi:hypothetical protein|nr:hypothetical protein [Blastocatellia bacterium]
MLDLCLSVIASRSKYDRIQAKLCQREKGHSGKHDEKPFLRELIKTNPQVANKIVRDAIMTTGASWKSEGAGPNRILRWVMLLSDEELAAFGIRMKGLKPQVVAKLRDKAATYEDCVQVAKKLTWLAYQMPDAPELSNETTSYLEEHFGKLQPNSAVCLVCREPLSFNLFSGAVRGKAIIETGHSNPRSHNAENVGFAHRECNIAQGSKTLPEFYGWIEEILKRAE